MLATRNIQTKEMTMGTGEIFPYFQCSKCNCLQIRDIPTEMGKYYPHDYYSIATAQNTIPNRFAEYIRSRISEYAITGKGKGGKLLFRYRPYYHLKEISTHTTKESRILDVGCGKGDMLMALKRFGYADLTGIDPFLEKEVNDPGLRILKSDIFNITGKWDRIVFNHSFEHMSDPLGVLKKATSLLEKEGKILIRVPTVSSFAWNEYKTNWYQLDAPRHFFLHSLESIEHIANRSNLNIRSLDYDSTAFSLIKSEQYQNDSLHQGNKSDMSDLIRRFSIILRSGHYRKKRSD